jgi:CRISPR system Cascade subunit CasA
MNLIENKWIPVRCADGSIIKIAPWEITQSINDNAKKIMAVASPRPDFDGALTQFLIGLLQTACTPETEDAWWDWLEAAPHPEMLKKLFNHFVPYFVLDGSSACFMQDLKYSELSETLGIGALLIESPGENTVKNNKDHFIKRDQIKQLCPDCSAAALYTLQLNAPAGGQGVRTGIRGGGPLTTLLVGNTLWETCWLNVLIRQNYIRENITPFENETYKRFPWLTSKQTGVETYFVDIHPDQYFWAMPRRVRLVEELLEKVEPCDLCKIETTKIYRHYKTKNNGINYMGSFEHPLSPHFFKNEECSPVHPQPGGFVYRHWVGFIGNSYENNSEIRSARVVNQFYAFSPNDGHIWAFGFDMDNAKARCWYEAKMPILIISEDKKALFMGYAGQLINSAKIISDALSNKIKKAIFGETDTKGSLAFTKTMFWRRTEDVFYKTLQKLRGALMNNQTDLDIKLDWYSTLSKEALAIFDEKSQTGDFESADPKRIAVARNELCSILYGKKIKNNLGLPIEKSKKTNS